MRTMYGTIKAYSQDVSMGVIACDTGNFYTFADHEWNGNVAPIVSQKVTFFSSVNTATRVFAEK